MSTQKYSDLLHRQFNLENPKQLGQPADPLAEARSRQVKPGDELTEPTHPLLHQAGHINPQRVIPYLDRLVEGEHLVLKVKHQVGEGLGVPIKERRRRAPGHPVQRRHPLLAIQQRIHNPSGRVPVTAVSSRPRLRHPHQQPTDRVTAIQRLKQAPNLLPVPHIPTLELRKSHPPAVNAVKNSRNLHSQPPHPQRPRTQRSLHSQGRPSPRRQVRHAAVPALLNQLKRRRFQPAVAAPGARAGRPVNRSGLITQQLPSDVG